MKKPLSSQPLVHQPRGRSCPRKGSREDSHKSCSNQGFRLKSTSKAAVCPASNHSQIKLIPFDILNLFGTIACIGWFQCFCFLIGHRKWCIPCMPQTAKSAVTFVNDRGRAQSVRHPTDALGKRSFCLKVEYE